MNSENSCLLIEGLTSVSALINAVKSGVNNRKIFKIIISESANIRKKRAVSFIHSNADALGYDIDIISDDKMSSLTSGSSHGGIAALCSERTFSALKIENLSKNGIFALLDGIEDPYNYAYTIRSLYAAGFDGIVIPPRNWSNAGGVVVRSSAGTSELMRTFSSDPAEAAAVFKNAGYRIVCAGIRDSVSLCDADLKAPLLLVIGGEKRGISRSLLNLSDCTVRIDYGRPFIGSLTTEVSASVIAFEIMHRNKE